MSDALADAYRRLAEALHHALAARGLAFEIDHHHARAGGSRYVLSAEERAVCLSWDGTSSCFRLECCSKQEGAAGAWQMLCEEHFDPATDGPARVEAIADRVSHAIASYASA